MPAVSGCQCLGGGCAASGVRAERAGGGKAPGFQTRRRHRRCVGSSEGRVLHRKGVGRPPGLERTGRQSRRDAAAGLPWKERSVPVTLTWGKLPSVTPQPPSGPGGVRTAAHPFKGEVRVTAASLVLQREPSLLLETRGSGGVGSCPRWRGRCLVTSQGEAPGPQRLPSHLGLCSRLLPRREGPGRRESNEQVSAGVRQ